jgi:hypothetical protein
MVNELRWGSFEERKRAPMMLRQARHFSGTARRICRFLLYSTSSQLKWIETICRTFILIDAPICASHPHRSEKKRTKTKPQDLVDIRNHEMLLGGKLELCFTPACVKRMNFIGLRPDHCPFQCFRATRTSASLMSGIQNPVLNSFSSVCVRCVKASSRRTGGRPLRRSCRSCVSSSSSRLIHLGCVSPRLEVGMWDSTYLFTSSANSASERGFSTV